MNTENKSDDARTDQRDKYLRAIIDTTKDAFFVIGEDEKIVDYNQAFLKITGLSRKEAQQIHLYDIVPPSESLAKIKNAERLLNTGSVLFEGFIKKKDGSIVDVELTTTLYSDKPFIVVCFARDITERKNAAKSLQNMHDLMQYIVEHSRSSVAIFDNERRYMYVSQPYIDSFPLRGVDIIGGYHYDISPNVPQSIRDIHTRALSGEVTRCEEDKYINADGSVEWTCWECRPWYQNNGQIGGYVLYAEIITERKLMEQALYDEKEHFRTALLSVGDGVISTDRSGRVTAMNPVAEKLTGQASADVLGKPAESILALYHEDSGMPYGGYVKQVMESCTVVESPGPIYIVSAAGAETPVELSAAPIRSSGGETAGAVLVIRDFTEKRAKQKEIEYLSYNDYVTGLYNRRYMEEAFKRLDTKMNLPLTVMVIDVNGLKLTNDAFGHDKGDLLLKEVGDLLKKTCRSSDIVGRMGGDEFCILLPNTDEIHAAMISGRIKDAAAHVHLDPIIVSLAVGYAVKRSSRQDLKTVMTTADNLMYKDKIKHGRAARGQTIDMILSTINLNYSQEQIHTERVSQFCEKIACALKMSEKDIREIRTAGALHDIGKIMVPPQLLNKAESLTADEFDIIKRHPEIGYQMLKSVDEYASLSEDVLYHHERYDGSGYPEGLSGDNIPLYARIIAVADAFEAMTAKRPYQKTKTRAEAVAELRRGAGTQFDPELVEVFIRAVIGPADGD